MLNLLELNLKEDYHIHSNFNDHSPDNLTISNIVDQAEKIGLEKFAITEHVRKTSDWIPEYLEQIKSLNRKNLIVGFEAKILPDGSINCPQEYMKNYFIIASFHGLFKDKKQWIKALESAIQNPDVNVIGHLGPEPTFDLTEDELIHLSKLIVSNNKIVEINAKYHLPLLTWVKIFKKNGVKFHLSSDAHSLSEIGDFKKISDLIEIIND